MRLLFLTASLASLLLSPAPAGRDDAALLATFDQVNGFDIETARLGVIRGHSEAVRALAALPCRDHSGNEAGAGTRCGESGTAVPLQHRASRL